MDLAEPSSQTPPLWPSGPIAYAIAQLRIEFPFSEQHQLSSAAREAAEAVAVEQGPMTLLQRAREILRARL